jgi:hypothetical protein
VSFLRPKEVRPTVPERPSTYGQTQGERTVRPVDDYAGQTEVETPPTSEYGEEPPGESAVGVYLVAPPPNDETYVEWNAMTVTVGLDSSQVASQDRRRNRVILRNLSDADDVVLTRNSTDSEFMGFLLLAGQEIEMLHNGGIWARTPVGTVDGVLLAVLTEFSLESYSADH